jgi:hypothetical protein
VTALSLRRLWSTYQRTLRTRPARSGMLWALDLRTSLRSYVDGLRVALDQLAATIPVAVQSREGLSAEAGMTSGALAMLGEALDQFRAEARADTAAVEALRIRLDGVERVRLLASFKTIETKVMTAYEVRVCVQQLREKYTRAAAADVQFREHLRATAAARANPPKSWMYLMRHQMRVPESQPIIVTINGVQHTARYALTNGVVTVIYRGEELSSVVGASANSTATILLNELVRTQLKRGGDM